MLRLRAALWRVNRRHVGSITKVRERNVYDVYFGCHARLDLKKWGAQQAPHRVAAYDLLAAKNIGSIVRS
jgi:hypothetical protein